MDKQAGDSGMSASERKGVRRYKRSESIVFRKTKEAFGGLSNMAAGFPITLGQLKVATSEALYQALRYPDFPDIQREILSIRNPMKAKMRSRKYYRLTRQDWNTVRIPIMRLVLRIKLINNWDRFSTLLLKTGDLPIVEESFRDTFWGAKPIDWEILEGVNALGRLLMELREKIKNNKKLLSIDTFSVPNLLLLGEPLSVFTSRMSFNVTYRKDEMRVPLFETEVLFGKHDGGFLNQLKPYPSYKDSGVPWLGKVPEGWEVKQLKRVARLNPSKTEVPHALRTGHATFLPMERVGNDGTFDASEIRSVKDLWNGFTYFRKGDVIVAKITPSFENGKGALLDSLPTPIGFGSTEFHVLRPAKLIFPRYLYLLTIHPEFRRLGADHMTGAAGQQRVPADFIANFPAPLPPLPEQRAIVKFLDWAERRIRFIIAARKRRIQLLEEYRQALINDAVTGKFDVRTGKPYPSYKDSGVPWLGKVPEHWKVRQLRGIAKVNNGYPFPSELFSKEGRYALIRIRDINKQTTETRYEGEFVEAAKVEPGDLLIGMDGDFTVGRWLGQEIALLNQRVCRVRSKEPVVDKFIYFCLPFPLKQIRDVTRGTTVRHLSSHDIERIKIPIPPADELTTIAEYLDHETKKIDAAIEKTKESIALWEELRETLISDVVTGKLDVREAAEQLPEAEPELEAKLEALEAALREQGEAAEPAEPEDQPEEAPA